MNIRSPSYSGIRLIGGTVQAHGKDIDVVGKQRILNFFQIHAVGAKILPGAVPMDDLQHLNKMRMNRRLPPPHQRDFLNDVHERLKVAEYVHGKGGTLEIRRIPAAHHAVQITGIGQLKDKPSGIRFQHRSPRVDLLQIEL